MPSSAQRRPLPALVSLVALLLLTGLVWWRVLNRSSGDTTHHAGKSACPSPSQSAQALPAPSKITIEVLNSTTKKGIATKARAALLADGFRSPSIAGNDVKELNKIKTTAQIRYAAVSRQAATLLGYYLPGSTLVATTSKSATVIVSLGAGYRTVASTATVTAALRRAGLVAGTPSSTASC